MIKLNRPLNGRGSERVLMGDEFQIVAGRIVIHPDHYRKLASAWTKENEALRRRIAILEQEQREVKSEVKRENPAMQALFAVGLTIFGVVLAASLLWASGSLK